jgi:hypothetical protein
MRGGTDPDGRQHGLHDSDRFPCVNKRRGTERAMFEKLQYLGTHMKPLFI